MKVNNPSPYRRCTALLAHFFDPLCTRNNAIQMFQLFTSTVNLLAEIIFNNYVGEITIERLDKLGRICQLE